MRPWPGKYFTKAELTHSNTARQRGVSNRFMAAPRLRLTAAQVEENFYNAVPKLDKFRELMGVPLKVNSGYRNPNVNALVNGASMSFHTAGSGFDISTVGHDRKKLVKMAIAAGFTGIGLGANFIHVDTGPRRVWPYPKGTQNWVPAFGRDPVSAVKNLLRP